MALKEIHSREDLKFLVAEFYKKVRSNNEIGDFFNKTIKDWPEHIEKLTDFWETNLFFVPKYKGNPLTIHQKVDQKTAYKINDFHFGIWLNLWYQTIDQYFYGDIADKAKLRARKIGTRLFLAIYENRKAVFSD